MGSISGPTPSAALALLRTSYDTGLLDKGEAARAQDFWMTIVSDDTSIDASGLTYLVQAATTPAIKREVVETVGQMGVRSIQQGRFINEIEMAITFREVVKGAAYKILKAWTKGKKYFEVTLELRSEATATSTTNRKWVITDCWIELDGADLSVEDAVPLKLSGTLHGSYFPASS